MQFMQIRLLSESIINQIAAGEVIERPASVVKELVENAIDAGATRIEIVTANGGKSLIRVSDNGEGIESDQLTLAISRHCTSKMGENVHDIRQLGFRGEALPSIGSVSKLKLVSRTADADSGAEIYVNAGKIVGPRPSPANVGTIVEVRDLFYVTPARQKFLKTDRAETSAITDIIKRIAIAFPNIRFSVAGSDRGTLDYPALGEGPKAQLGRIAQILGKDFTENSVPIYGMRDGVTLTGFAGIPSYNRANSLMQFGYINGRPIRDKLVWGAIRGAYSDVIAKDRNAVAVLFITMEPADVDVNVHPAKADVRFRDSGLVRGLIVGAIREALANAGIRPASTGAAAMLSAFRPHQSSPFWQPSPHAQTEFKPSNRPWTPQTAFPTHQPLFSDQATHQFSEPQSRIIDEFSEPSSDLRPAMQQIEPEKLRYPLGVARAQIHQNYIVSQTSDSLIIIDQHAAHERLVYEALKRALYAKPLPSQLLLIPEIVDLTEEAAAQLMVHASTLEKFGLIFESFGPGAIAVRATPAMLGEVDIQGLIKDLADEASDDEIADGLKAKLDHVAATMACHSSVRSGRILKAEEMDQLLRQMEATPGSGTCNHGRPTYIELKLTDIERLFGR